MKKFCIVLLALCLVLSLAACGQEEAPAPTQAPAPVATAAPAPVVTEAPAPTEAPVEEAPAEPSDFEKAESCIDGSVEDLYALIGEPISADYAPSCLGGVATGGEDGMLYYDGFIVYTYREGGEESVYTVMPE
ncbi:MAG: hypothetical protein IJE26_04240 [Oscillospiraceae bacterium]|nr:hypothetical protein [Oscillospiraceae bacterium]